MAPLYMRSESLLFLDPQKAASGLRARAARNPGIRVLREKAIGAGFKPVTGAEAGWGFDREWVRSDRAKAKVKVQLEAFKKAGTKDAVAVITIEVTGEGKKEEYNAYLVAPNGDFDKAEEYYSTPGGTVRKANSFWTRFKKCVRAECGGACIAALATCIPASSTWVGYFICYGASCGSCLGKCFGCAGCSCRWWCKWAAGCCRD